MRLVLLLAPSLLLASAAALAGDPAPVDASLTAFKEGDYAKAAGIAEKVGADDPAYAKARYLLGEARLAAGDASAAEQAFRESLAKKADAVPTLAGLGRALQAKGSHEEALKTVQRAVLLDGKDAGARRALGEVLAAQGKAAEGRKELDQAVKLDPKDPLTARALVELCIKESNLGGALKAAERLVQADDKAPMGYFLRGLVLDKSGMDKEAIEAYEASLAKDPKLLDAHKNLAILCVAKNPLYQDRERTKKAMEHFEKYFELGGKDDELKQAYSTMKSFLDSQRGK